jgi:hypothetical protein
VSQASKGDDSVTESMQFPCHEIRFAKLSFIATGPLLIAGIA